MPDLQESVAVVTGASSGIGEAAARRLGTEGASIVVADVEAAGGEATAADVEAAGGEATFVETDVSDPAAVDAMVETAVETYGGLDVAVNNAGIEGASEPLADQPIDNWDRVIDVNLKGVFLGMRAEIPAMLADGGGAIVNTASVAGQVAFANISPYVASKHGVLGLTKNAAAEYSGEGVRVNAVCPGVIETPMVERSREDDPEMIEGAVGATPIGRLGKPDEIGDAVAWLASEESSFVTGEALVVDGGYVTQ